VDAGGQSEATPFFTSTASTILIRGGKVVNAEEETEADVLVVEGIITKVEPDIPAPDGAMIIDARSEFAYVHLVVFTVQCIVQ
jgi:dihydroorotase-like cyclic amidohydrolase